ncbi:MAG TPA: T9SS type A sorting domain-containing protein, partial [Saprospiraceae bacterium]|nr:T9SS type A sorting domain-containing protein [Saprospiraceae bacterium]
LLINENIFLSGDYDNGNISMGDCQMRNISGNVHGGFILSLNKKRECNCIMDILNTGDITKIGLDSKNNIYYTGLTSNVPLLFRNYVYTPKFATGSAILAKFDSNCNLLWIKEFGDKNLKAEVHISSMAIDALDNIILSGSTYADTVDFGGKIYIKSPLSKKRADILVKLNSNGDIQWINASKQTGFSYIYKTIIDHDNNILIGASVDLGGLNGTRIQFDSTTISNNSSLERSYVYVYKFTSDGKAMLGKLISGEKENIIGPDIAIDSKDNIYIGASFDHNYFIFNHDTLWKSDTTLWFNHLLLKYDKNGAENWARHWDPGIVNFGRPYISIDYKDNVWCHFSYENQAMTIGNKVLKSKGKYDCALLQFSQDGENLFSYTYGSEGYDYAGAFQNMNDGSMILSGEYEVKELKLGNHTLKNEGVPLSNGSYPRNIFLARFAPDSLVSNHEIKKVDVGYSVYPNPASDNIIVSSKEDINAIKTIELYNLEGKRSHIKFKKESSNKMSFSGKELLDGVYLLKILTDDGVENIKIQIQH